MKAKAIKIFEDFRCYKGLLIIICLSGVLSQTACNKLVDIDPPGNQIVAENVYTNDVTSIAVLNGVYSNLSGLNFTSTQTIPTISFWAGLSADEFNFLNVAFNAKQSFYFKNSLASGTSGSEFWLNVYPLIYTCNAAIEGLSNSTSLTPGVRNQLLGEAKFMRALFYFYLVNLYGDVPLVISTDYTVNALLPRTPVALVYQQIIKDLIDAQQILADGYVKGDAITSSVERVRPCKATATALLARVYLYTNEWSKAEMQATAIINNTAMYDTVPLNKVFLKNSKEAIWQLQPVTTAPVNTWDAFLFVPTRPPAGINSTHPVYLSNMLLNSFESGDLRKVNGNWVNVYSDATGTYYYPFKYKDITQGAGTPTEYTTLFRIGEQYLIRAEARARLNNISGSQSDLNVIRRRAGLSNTIATDQTSLLQAILNERQVELFTELGHRWLDLKRTGNVDAVMTIVTPIKGGIWNSYQQLYPIPLNDMVRNPNLVQNLGY